jgi:DNA repair protein RadD
MILRPRQELFLQRVLTALEKYDDTLGIAPTGAGKTVLFCHLLSRLIEQEPGKKALVLAHRDELTTQNAEKFRTINPSISTSIVNADQKDWSGQVVFAMVQTLSRETNLDQMPPVDFLVIDEAHHSTSDTYLAIIDEVKKKSDNPKHIGFTATPNRSDGQGLRTNYSNVADQIFVGELIRSGHLVPPRTFIIDVGAQDELRSIRQVAGDFDMGAVDEIMNREPINEAVVEQWQEKGEGRKTVVFCSTVEHATSVHQAFLDQKIKAELITGELSKNERAQALERYHAGDSQVVVNVAVLTEGWDYPPTSCVVLLRPSSAMSTMIQMVGRGLRTVDHREFPDVQKRDCIVLDFGISSLLHGSLEQDVDLDGNEGKYADLVMPCPECEAEIPISSRECPLCGYEFETARDDSPREKTALSHVEMVEINLLDRSNFQWVDLFLDEKSFYSSGFNAWGGVFSFKDTWIALGGKQTGEVEILAQGDRIQCFASADDWLNAYETEDTVHKTRSWLKEEPTSKQFASLPSHFRLDFNMTRYRASTLIGFRKNKMAIKKSCESTDF